ncbi:acyl-CoA carboxylase epsilon subunit [Streptomyces sp. NPDC001393]
MRAQEPDRGQLRIVRGRPTPEELAALAAVLYALAAQRRERQAEREEKEYRDLIAAGGAVSRSVLRSPGRNARPWTTIPFPTWRA